MSLRRVLAALLGVTALLGGLAGGGVIGGSSPAHRFNAIVPHPYTGNTSPPPPGVPVNTAVPTISGTAQQAQALTESHGTWTNAPLSYTFQWQDCDNTGASCVDIGGATSQTYTLVVGDVGDTIRVKETASNGAGASTAASSAATAVVTASGGGGAGALCSPSPCTTPTEQTFTVTADDGGAAVGDPHNWNPNPTVGIWRPGNLVNDPSHSVALIFSASANNALSTWVTELAADKAVLVDISGQNTNNNYFFPTENTGGGSSSCGGSGGDICDQIPEVQAVLAKVECNGSFPCMNIDPTKVYFTGSSKGATLPQGVMCDERTSTEGRGYGMDSNSLLTTGPSSATPPNCPALGQTCSYAPSCTGATNKDLSLIWLWGTADPTSNFGGGTCAGGTNCLYQGFQNNAGKWVFGTGQEANPLSPTVFGGTWLGCPTTPTTNQTFGNTGKLNRRYFSNCANAPNPTLTATGLVQVSDGGHQPEGVDGLDTAQEFWNFWQTFPG